MDSRFRLVSIDSSAMVSSSKITLPDIDSLMENQLVRTSMLGPWEQNRMKDMELLAVRLGTICGVQLAEERTIRETCDGMV